MGLAASGNYAAMSSARSPGAVFRVWRIRQRSARDGVDECPGGVAMPDARWRRLSIGRSARRMSPEIDPCTTPTVAPAARLPSVPVHATVQPQARATASAKAAPARTPPLRYSIDAGRLGSGGYGDGGGEVELAVLGQGGRGDAVDFGLLGQGP